jgi:hypothetical protein
MLQNSRRFTQQECIKDNFVDSQTHGVGGPTSSRKADDEPEWNQFFTGGKAAICSPSFPITGTHRGSRGVFEKLSFWDVNS